MRDDTVFLKTVSGLKRVHAIPAPPRRRLLRPAVELRADSALGVPGLLGAVRRRQVLVANAWVQGLLESAALPGFLPGICRHLLGEELAMPSVATWWCGEAPAAPRCSTTCATWCSSPPFPGAPARCCSATGSAEAARRPGRAHRGPPDRLRRPGARQAVPRPGVGRRPPAQAAPAGDGPARLCGDHPEGYSVLPGGLAGWPASNTRILTLQKGGGAAGHLGALRRAGVPPSACTQNVIGVDDLIGETGTLSSRLAENLFWFGRYSERCDAVARLARLALTRLSEGPPHQRARALR